MEFDHDNVRRVVEEDRLSSLPDDLIHRILSCFDMKFVVQMCLLLPRWKHIWTSMPCLIFSSGYFGNLPAFDNFVTRVLSHRNHHIEVSSVKLHFHGVASNQVLLQKISDYAFSHNVQELTVIRPSSGYLVYPPCLFSSQSLKHFTLTCSYFDIRDSTKTPLHLPALTTLNLSRIALCGDLFSNCVNLKSLTLEHFRVVCMVEAFDIITPRLFNLMLIDGDFCQTINLIAPELEINLTVIKCSIKYLNAPPGLSSFCYTSELWYNGVVQFSNDRFHSLNKVTICLSIFELNKAYKKEDARKTINMLQKPHSARYLTLDADTVECISAFPDLLSQHSSPFSNLICLTIDSTMRKDDAYKVKMSTEATNFLFENSPSATLIMK